MGSFCTRLYESQIKTEVLTSRANDVREPNYEQRPIVKFVDLLPDSKGVIPRARQHHSLLFIDEHRILCYGGICANLDTDNSLVDALPRKNPGLAAQPSVYSVLDDTWRPLIAPHGEPPIQPRALHSAALTDDGKVIVFGNHEKSDPHVHFLDTTSGFFFYTWRPLIAPHGEPPIQPRALHSAALTDDGKVIVFGNHEKSDPHVHFLDTISGSWDTLTTSSGNAPGALLGHSATMLDGQLMAVFGGENALGVSNALYLFDSEERHWTRIVNRFSNGDTSIAKELGRRDHTMVRFEHKLFLFGGVSPNSDALAFLQFDAETVEWSRVDEQLCILADADVYNPSTSQETNVAAVSSSQKYVDDVDTAPHEQKTPSTDHHGLVSANRGPPPRKGHSCTMHHHYMIVFGGLRRSVYLNDLWVFDSYAGIWTPISVTGGAPPLRRAFAGSCCDEVFWYIHNGGNENCFFRSLLRVDANEIVRSADSTFRIPDSRWSERRRNREITNQLRQREKRLAAISGGFSARLSRVITKRSEEDAILQKEQFRLLWLQLASVH
ncbi:Hypothetical protein, putative [Bodo saltans]|uniref:Uncharacterized protein n=1 Tax=Bodo saltans TaxID=75058 RepID=A0A0S4IRF3_BODSA|nr:Hypothetical protein, putative [Bodo saltans]|eukprot:CUF36196.1 Hypothetical protein, putative [Bodo saltans]